MTELRRRQQPIFVPTTYRDVPRDGESMYGSSTQLQIERLSKDGEERTLQRRTDKKPIPKTQPVVPVRDAHADHHLAKTRDHPLAERPSTRMNMALKSSSGRTSVERERISGEDLLTDQQGER
jgi:hypothetical protein